MARIHTPVYWDLVCPLVEQSWIYYRMFGDPVPAAVHNYVYSLSSFFTVGEMLQAQIREWEPVEDWEDFLVRLDRREKYILYHRYHYRAPPPGPWEFRAPQADETWL